MSSDLHKIISYKEKIFHFKQKAKGRLFQKWNFSNFDIHFKNKSGYFENIFPILEYFFEKPIDKPKKILYNSARR